MSNTQNYEFSQFSRGQISKLCLLMILRRSLYMFIYMTIGEDSQKVAEMIYYVAEMIRLRRSAKKFLTGAGCLGVVLLINIFLVFNFPMLLCLISTCVLP